MEKLSDLIKLSAKILEAGNIDTTIEVEVKNIYGSEKIYVVSSHKEALQTLTGSKTLTPTVTEALKKLGFTIKERGRSERVF